MISARVFDADEPAVAERRLRTTNRLQRFSNTTTRRTWVATLLPHEASLLRLASAVISDISEISADWATKCADLTTKAR